MRYVEADLRKMAEAVVDRARRVCIANSVRFYSDCSNGRPRIASRRLMMNRGLISFLPKLHAMQVHALIEVVEGEPRYVLCNAAEKHHADLLVVGSHGYGAIKRSVPFLAWLYGVSSAFLLFSTFVCVAGPFWGA